ncbi:MAG: hypothetical protein CVU46_10170 [Chloroflexi bacterium HGW-Chloroflexi-8]|nr:MAG: hypothetical protein CVU46_10170 [Chloroflexi bacterium HGW-Chloroflexi-8]
MLQSWKEKANQLKREIYTLWIAYRKPGVPMYAKAFCALVVAYAFSPIDLIPDFIPVLGYLDDLVLIPMGVALAIKLIPSEILAQSRIEAQQRMDEGHKDNWVVGGLIVLLWVAVVVFVVWKLRQ